MVIEFRAERRKRKDPIVAAIEAVRRECSRENMIDLERVLHAEMTEEEREAYREISELYAYEGYIPLGLEEMNGYQIVYDA